MKGRNARSPTAKERAALARIYGDESNWMGVATATTKIRRAQALGEKRRGLVD